MAKQSLETSVVDFTLAVGLLVRRVRAAAANHQLSLTEASVLARLDKEGPRTTADLARAESMKPQSMATTIASLEKMQLIARRSHPTDGRQVNIELSSQGIALRKSTGEAKRTWLMQSITRLEKHEQETLFAAGKIIKRLAEL